MEINGRTVRFKRTIWATNAIMEMCPGNDLGRFSELFEGTASDQIITMAGFIVVLSQAYEQAAAFEARRRGEEYTQDPLTLDEIMSIEDMKVFEQLQTEAVKAWVKDAETTVESEPIKSKKKAKSTGKR